MLEDMFLLKQLVSSPTRVTKNTSSRLDVILTSDNDKHSSTHVYKTSLNDDYLLFTKLNMQAQREKHKEINFRD